MVPRRTFFSFYATPILLAAYGWLVYNRRRERKAGGPEEWPEPQ